MEKKYIVRFQLLLLSQLGNNIENRFIIHLYKNKLFIKKIRIKQYQI